jgi:hypothetical protein
MQQAAFKCQYGSSKGLPFYAYKARMSELVVRHATSCIAVWERGAMPEEPTLTEERIGRELRQLGLADTAPNRTIVREVFMKELAEYRRDVKRDLKSLYGLMWSSLTPEGPETIRMQKDFEQVFVTSGGSAAECARGTKDVSPACEGYTSAPMQPRT